MLGFTSLAFFLSSALVYAAPVPRANLDSVTLLNNGHTAQSLNAQYQNLTTNAACNTGDVACIGGALANCVESKWETQACPASLSCFAVPSLTEPGANVQCTSERNLLSTIQATGAANVPVLANATEDSGDTCDSDSDSDNGGTQEGADNGNDDTCESDGGDDDNGNDDTCDTDGGDEDTGDDDNGDDTCDGEDGESGTTTVTATATPTASGEKTVTVTITPDSPATTTVSVAAPTDITTFGPSTTIVRGDISSLISSFVAGGASVVTIISPTASGIALPDASGSDSSVIQLTPAAAAAAASSSTASASAAAPDQDSNNNAAAPSVGLQPVLTFVPAAPAATTSGSVALAASASSEANPFGFSDY